MVEVVLRPMEPEDLAVLYQIERERSAWAVSSSGIPYSKYVLKQFLANQPADIFQSGELRLTIQDLDTGEAVGVADLYGYNPMSLKAEVGIALLKQKEGRGYARDALNELMKLAQRKFRIHQLYAYIKVSNVRSIKLFQSAGFCITATLKDWVFEDGAYHDVYLLQKFFQKSE